MIGEAPQLTPTDFIAVVNQALEYSFSDCVIVGEVQEFRVSKNKWVYFNLVDEFSSVKFFGTVYQLTGPLEDGMMVQVRGLPRLHQLYGFSVNVLAMQPVGEGSIKKASELLFKKLHAEGLFDPERKRLVAYPPQRIALITSAQSAAYADFIKVLKARWGGIEIAVYDVHVQGEQAPRDIARAIEVANQSGDFEALVITRGGGSMDDLAAFSTEQVVRAIAGSRTPTVVAIGHEVDESLAELAADMRASTPSNAAELLVPDRIQILRQLHSHQALLTQQLKALVTAERSRYVRYQELLQEAALLPCEALRRKLTTSRQLLELVNPEAVLKRGYAIVRDDDGAVISSAVNLKPGRRISLQVSGGVAKARIE